jgi:hypothetical protein
MMVGRDKMQNGLDIVQDVSARLDGANIGYMLTGSMAMNCYAQPRMTRDIDFVVALQSADAARAMVLASLPAGLSPDELKPQQLREKDPIICLTSLSMGGWMRFAMAIHY